MAEKKKILIIDDEKDFAHFVKLNLESTNKFEVVTSAAGKEGIILAKTKKPDLILLDIFMPEMDGSEVAERLLDDAATKDIPIVFLTALVTKRDVGAKGGVIGGRQVIAKPVAPDELISTINSVLQ